MLFPQSRPLLNESDGVLTIQLDLDDSLLAKSLVRSERSDPDFEAQAEEEDMELKLVLPRSTDVNCDRVFLVYESKLMALLQRCSNYGAPIEEINEKQRTGIQYHAKMFERLFYNMVIPTGNKFFSW